MKLCCCCSWSRYSKESYISHRSIIAESGSLFKFILVVQAALEKEKKIVSVCVFQPQKT